MERKIFSLSPEKNVDTKVPKSINVLQKSKFSKINARK